MRPKEVGLETVLQFIMEKNDICQNGVCSFARIDARHFFKRTFSFGRWLTIAFKYYLAARIRELRLVERANYG